jgi:hypothetical protein
MFQCEKWAQEYICDPSDEFVLFQFQSNMPLKSISVFDNIYLVAAF